MLLLSPPYLQSGRLTIFKDDKNTDIFYYACTEPKIVTDENGDVKLFASAILPETGVMSTERSTIVEATVSMDVELKPTEQELENAKLAIKEEWRKNVKLLSPAPIIDGSVYMLVASAGVEPKPDEFFITPKVSPTILGSNTASLMAKAEGLHATNMIASLTEDIFTASVFYELNILGISPSFNARMHVDWEKVYTHFEETKKIDYIFVKEEIQKSARSLAETNAIEIEIEELDPDSKNAATRQLFDQLQEKIIEKLFNPSPMPKAIASDIAEGASRVISALLPGAHYIRKEKKDVQTASTTLDISERKAKKIAFYPQALLSSLIAEVGGIKDDIEWIKLDDMPFRSQVVDVSLAADTFKTANIKSVKLDCRVSQKSDGEVEKIQSFIYSSGEPMNNKFNFINKQSEEYIFEYKASIFLDSKFNELPSSLELDWSEASGAFIYFNAAQFFEPTELNVGIDDSSIFKHSHLIQVDVDVLSQEDQLITQKTFILNEKTTDYQEFRIIAPKDKRLKSNLEVTYFMKDAPEYKVSHNNFNKPYFFVENPFESKWNSEVSCIADWESTSKLIAEFRVFDVSRQEYIFDKHHFTKESTMFTLEAVTSLETPKSQFEYRLTAITSSGKITRSSWKKHRGPALIISDNFSAERTIRATLTSSPNFEKKEIRKATIQFRYDDGENSPIDSEKLKFNKVGDVTEFTHTMPNHNAQEYEYRLMVIGENGERYKTEWIKELADDLTITIPDDIW